MILELCSGKQKCEVFLPETQIPRCGSSYADFLDFEYQCIPASPSQGVKNYTCNDKEVSDVQNGFIQSPDYPSQVLDINCEIKVIPPANRFVKFYFVDLSLKNTDATKFVLFVFFILSFNSNIN